MKKIFIFFLILLVGVFSVFADDWVSMDSGTEQNLHSVFMFNSLTGYVGGGLGMGYDDNEPVILKTVDGGDSWESLALPGELIGSDVIYDVCFSDLENGFAVGSGGIILRTEDGGDNWIQQTSPSSSTNNGIWCINEDTSVVVGNLGTILRTTGDGIWTEQLDGVSEALFDVYFVGDIGYAVGDNGVVYKSVNGGIDWDAVTSVVSESGINIGLNAIFCLDSESCWVTGANEVAYKTEDGGEEWIGYDTGEDVSSIRGIFFKDSEEGYIVGQQTIRYTDTGGDTWETEHADISYDSGDLPVNLMRDVQCILDVCWGVGDEGTILRLNEPLVVTIYNPPTELELDEPEQPEDCPVFFDDCEAGWNPVFEYGEDGCISGYECVKEDQKYLDDLTQNIEQFSSFVGEIPSISENENINVYIDDKIKGILIKDGVVTLVDEEFEIATYSVYLSEETLSGIIDAEDSVNEAKTALKNKDLVIKGEKLGTKVKTFFMKIALNFM